MKHLINDAGFALRMYLKKPMLTAVTLLALALGIGANTAIFSLLDSVVLRPLPFPDSDRIVALTEDNRSSGIQQNVTSLANYIDWKQQSTSFECVSAAAYGLMTLSGSDEPEMLQSLFVSASLFRLFGVKPMLGRTFRDEEDYSDKASVVILSHKLWQRRFHGDPEIIDRAITLNNRKFTVVGVMPPGFTLYNPQNVSGFPSGITESELWRPLTIWNAILQDRENRDYLVLAKLKSGVSMARAQTEMNMIARRLEQAYPKTNQGWGVTVLRWREQIVANSRSAVLILMGAVGFVLLIACVNIASLLLTLAFSRQREFIIRAAVGAGRFRLVCQLMVESLILSLAGGGLGLGFAAVAVKVLGRLCPSGLPRVGDIEINGSIMLFTLGISIATGLLFGLAPALSAMTNNLSESLQSDGSSRGSTASRRSGCMRDVLVVSEVALTLLLLVGAGLMIRSFENLLRVDPNFKSERLLAFDFGMAGAGYTNQASRLWTIKRAVEQLNSIPGVSSSAAIYGLPFGTMLTTDVPIDIEGISNTREPKKTVGYRIATDDYFKTLGIPLVGGRLFSPVDTVSSPPVVVINEATASLFGTRDPIGQRIRLEDGGPNPCLVVGIIRNIKSKALTVPAEREVYRNMAQFSGFYPLSFIIKSQGKPELLIRSVRREFAQIDPTQALYNVRTMEEALDRSMASTRFLMLLISTFAGFAIVLASIGIYGVMTYSVSQRNREIGIRMALGADQSEIVKMILRRGALLVASGVLLGMVGAYWLSKSLAGYVFGITTSDPVTWVAVAVILNLLGLFFCYLPARSASSVDPIMVLRN